MRKLDPKVALLRRVSMLAGQPDRELAQIAALVDEIDAAPGRVLTREGSAGGEAFLIVEGTAEVVIGGQRVATVGPGEFIGEMALLDHSPRSATVTAITPMRLFVMSPAGFAAMVRQPTAGWRLAASLAARLRGVEGAPTYDLPDPRPARA